MHDDQPCESCGKPAQRILPSSVSGSFRKEVTGPVPQNTGISGLDAHIDRVIGQSAEQGREVIQKRHEDKLQVLAQHPDKDGHDLSRRPEGGYEVLEGEERGVHERANTINRLAMENRQKKAGEPVKV